MGREARRELLVSRSCSLSLFEKCRLLRWSGDPSLPVGPWLMVSGLLRSLAGGVDWGRPGPWLLTAGVRQGVGCGAPSGLWADFNKRSHGPALPDNK